MSDPSPAASPTPARPARQSLIDRILSLVRREPEDREDIKAVLDAARSREIEGSGLGLSLAREMARAHGGDLVLAHSDARGTAFVLSLPLDHARQL